MAVLELVLDKGLSVSELQVKLDNVIPNNDMCVYSDGLYVNGSTYDGSGNIKLKNKLHFFYVNTDMSPWDANYNGDTDRFANHVCCDCQAHRCWNAEWDTDDENTRKPKLISGKNEEDKFRDEIDWVLPGDFFRVKIGENRYEYYIITEVSPGPTVKICDGCGQLIYPYEDWCSCGNPKYYYNKEDNPHYKPDDEDTSKDTDTSDDTSDTSDTDSTKRDAPKICPDCGQPILKPQTDGIDELIGLPGNEPVSWALLGTAGDW